ncbi:MAG: GntR family transcriptional regulator [Bacillota bacterium]
MVPINLDNYKPLRELVFESIRDAILSGNLPPGERLMEIQLADEMGVSRTPVREALRKLELDGLVVVAPRKGAYVAGISSKDITEVFEIRGALEGLAAELAVERITEEELDQLEKILYQVASCVDSNNLEGMIDADTHFHEMLYLASRNARLSQIVHNLREQIQRFRKFSLSSPGRMREALEEHKAIVDAIAQRNANLACQLAKEHIENAESSFMQAMQNAPEQLIPGEETGGEDFD